MTLEEKTSGIPTELDQSFLLSTPLDVGLKMSSIFHEKTTLRVTNLSTKKLEGVTSISRQPQFGSRKEGVESPTVSLKKMSITQVKVGDIILLEFKGPSVSGEFTSEVKSLLRDEIIIEFPSKIIWRDRRGNRRIPLVNKDVILILPSDRRATVCNVSLSGISFLFEGQDSVDLGVITGCEIEYNDSKKEVDKITVLREELIDEQRVFSASIDSVGRNSIDAFLQNIINRSEIHRRYN